MSPDKQQSLLDEFPLIYRQFSNPESCMSRGFECDDGWHQLIYDMSLSLELEAHRQKLDCPSVECPSVAQIKEKFGQLTVYLDHGTTKAFGIVDFAFQASGKHCELCGDKGSKVRKINDFWVKSICSKCLRSNKTRWAWRDD